MDDTPTTGQARILETQMMRCNNTGMSTDKFCRKHHIF